MKLNVPWELYIIFIENVFKNKNYSINDGNNDTLSYAYR